MKIIIDLSESEYQTLITFINRKYLVDAVSLLNELKNRGNIKIDNEKPM